MAIHLITFLLRAYQERDHLEVGSKLIPYLLLVSEVTDQGHPKARPQAPKPHVGPNGCHHVRDGETVVDTMAARALKGTCQVVQPNAPAFRVPQGWVSWVRRTDLMGDNDSDPQ
jgi:hypothetical protein